MAWLTWPVGPTVLPPRGVPGQGSLGTHCLAYVTCWPAALGGQRAVQPLAALGPSLSSWFCSCPGREQRRANSLVPRSVATGGRQSCPMWLLCDDPAPELRFWLPRSKDLLCAGSRDVQEPPGCIGVEFILVPAQRPHVQHT